MKKIVSPLTAGGAPWTNDLFLNIQDQLYTALEGLLSGIIPIAGTGNIGVIISGCVVTFISGSNYSCSSGIVYLNGTFMFFPGWASTTLPQYIVAASPIVVTDTWANASTNNLTSDQQATYQGTIPGSGQYIGLTISGNIGYTIGGKRYENLNILGVADNTPAVGKQIGEIISTSNNSHTQATSGSYENVQIIVLSPGDWDLFANYTISSLSSTMSGTSAIALSTTTASNAGCTDNINLNYISNNALGGSQKLSGLIKQFINISVNTTYYLNASIPWSGSAPAISAYMHARRMR